MQGLISHIACSQQQKCRQHPGQHRQRMRLPAVPPAFFCPIGHYPSSFRQKFLYGTAGTLLHLRCPGIQPDHAVHVAEPGAPPEGGRRHGTGRDRGHHPAVGRRYAGAGWQPVHGGCHRV